jgi:hypothetical protein
MSPATDNFENRLLHELQTRIAERPAPAPAPAARPARVLPRRVILVGGAGAAVAATVVLGTGGSGPRAAYAVEREADGSVTVEINSLRDADGLERKLNAAGVPAKVDYLPAGMTCRGGRFSTSQGAGGRFGMQQSTRTGGSTTFTVDPGQLRAGQTLVITSSLGAPTDDHGTATSVGVALAQGTVAPCVPVKDPHPLPPAAAVDNGRGIESRRAPSGAGPSLDSHQ